MYAVRAPLARHSYPLTAYCFLLLGDPHWLFFSSWKCDIFLDMELKVIIPNFLGVKMWEIMLQSNLELMTVKIWSVCIEEPYERKRPFFRQRYEQKRAPGMWKVLRLRRGYCPSSLPLSTGDSHLLSFSHSDFLHCSHYAMMRWCLSTSFQVPSSLSDTGWSFHWEPLKLGKIHKASNQETVLFTYTKPLCQIRSPPCLVSRLSLSCPLSSPSV